MLFLYCFKIVKKVRLCLLLCIDYFYRNLMRIILNHTFPVDFFLFLAWNPLHQLYQLNHFLCVLNVICTRMFTPSFRHKLPSSNLWNFLFYFIWSKMNAILCIANYFYYWKGFIICCKALIWHHFHRESQICFILSASLFWADLLCLCFWFFEKI